MSPDVQPPSSNAAAPLAHHAFRGSLGAPLAHVDAVIAHVLPGNEHHHGAQHQHLIVIVTRLIAFAGLPADKAPQIGARMFVAIRFGDEDGLAEAIPDLAEGMPIELRGEYIDPATAYPTVDNSGPEHLPVLHFTHAPVGFVIYARHRYS
ncbi:hypothetical protein Y88_0813 [Novosphingobium nitrogenifigens DSM 19370]|uniref:Uncharacterized protein n=1 Tax=Novosphingobium nitrogenifigens DSM 19370 TaxID=983920 RepID=F1Z9I7_9SPHN|nr:hypothetical protein [Novosphingobium nitrogenifigens]EGD58755.1 hypothetical protein Y88_0813 [Novosphingobium nitrogenifigens DSM 19370]